MTIRDDGPDPVEAAFEGAMAPWRAIGGPLCILYSGGVDSGAIAWELRSRPLARLFTIGRKGSPELAFAESSSRLIGLPWSGHEVLPGDLDRAEAKVSAETHSVPPTVRSVLLSLAIAVQNAPAGDLLCGQGADELFLGYAHFAGLGSEQAESRSRADLDRLVGDDWPRTQRIASLLGRRIHAPLLDPKFVASALDVPVERRLPVPVPKGYWRELVRRRGVPAEIADRPKRALQYGSGVDKWLRRAHPRQR